MAQMIPSVLLYGQAIKLLDDLRDAQAQGLLQDTGDVLHKLAEILTQFEDSAGTPLVRYEDIVETEPPSSAKINRLWDSVEKDVNLLQQQVDILKAATVFSHNIITTDIAAAKAANARVDNKLKTLQMYSDSVDSKTVTFSDSFRSLEFVDNERVPDDQRALLAGEGYMTLSRSGSISSLSGSSVIQVMDTSNGFLGNNQEIENPSISPKEPDTGANVFAFKSESKEYNNLAALTDQEPNTWIEYENYLVPDADKRSASNFNFDYSKVSSDGNVEYIDWADGPKGNVLNLFLQFDLNQIQAINYIEYQPYGLENNTNFPVFIKEVQTSTDTTDWKTILPINIWLGTETNVQAARTADNVTIGSAVWAFQARPARYIRFSIQQPNPVNVRVGHIYYLDATGQRVLGPVPSIGNPAQFNDQTARGDIVQRREFFNGKRWAIGIRDILLQQVEYSTTSVIISKPLRVGGIVDRVVLDKASIYVPAEYPTDQMWVKFYVSPNDGIDWFQISRIQDDYLGIPEQIAFNDPIPQEFRESGVGYYSVDGTVTNLRLKVEISRPASAVTTTPILRSYVLKVRRR